MGSDASGEGLTGPRKHPFFLLGFTLGPDEPRGMAWFTYQVCLCVCVYVCVCDKGMAPDCLCSAWKQAHLIQSNVHLISLSLSHRPPSPPPAPAKRSPSCSPPSHVHCVHALPVTRSLQLLRRWPSPSSGSHPHPQRSWMAPLLLLQWSQQPRECVEEKQLCSTGKNGRDVARSAFDQAILIRMRS